MMIGQYNRLVMIEHRAVAANHLQAIDARWDTYATCWCAIETKVGDQTTEENQQQSRAQRVLTTHWSTRLAGVTTAMRVVLPGGRRGEITSVENVDEANREIRIECVIAES